MIARRLIVSCALAAAWAAYFVYLGLTEADHGTAIASRIETTIRTVLSIITLIAVNTALVTWHLNRTLDAIKNQIELQRAAAPRPVTAVGRVYRSHVQQSVSPGASSSRPGRRRRRRKGGEDTAVIGLDPGTIESARRLSDRLRGED